MYHFAFIAILMVLWMIYFQLKDIAAMLSGVG